jgi:hippurate hydrolase
MAGGEPGTAPGNFWQWFQLETAGMTTMIDRIKAKAAERLDAVVNMRRYLHQRPELGFDLFETTSFVSQQLDELGIPHQTGIAKTGIVATIQGSRPGPTIALRADMDALPITEQTDLPFASRNPGQMHACGHDGHTASLLGTAAILCEMKNEIRGNIRLLFQPSEEKLPGGAPSMIEEGALGEFAATPAVTTVFGQHVSPNLPTGVIGVRPGMYMVGGHNNPICCQGCGCCLFSCQ